MYSQLPHSAEELTLSKYMACCPLVGGALRLRGDDIANHVQRIECARYGPTVVVEPYRSERRAGDSFRILLRRGALHVLIRAVEVVNRAARAIPVLGDGRICGAIGVTRSATPGQVRVGNGRLGQLTRSRCNRQSQYYPNHFSRVHRHILLGPSVRMRDPRITVMRRPTHVSAKLKVRSVESSARPSRSKRARWLQPTKSASAAHEDRQRTRSRGRGRPRARRTRVSCDSCGRRRRRFRPGRCRRSPPRRCSGRPLGHTRRTPVGTRRSRVVAHGRPLEIGHRRGLAGLVHRRRRDDARPAPVASGRRAFQRANAFSSSS